MSQHLTLTNILLLLSGLGGLALGFTVRRPPVQQSLFTAHQPGPETPESGPKSVGMLPFIIAACGYLAIRFGAPKLAEMWALPGTFVLSANHWIIGICLSLLLAPLAQGVSERTGVASASERVHCGLGTAAASFAVLLSPGARVDALLGAALGWCVVTTLLKESRERALISAAFTALICLTWATAMLRDALNAPGQSRWFTLTLGLTWAALGAVWAGTRSEAPRWQARVLVCATPLVIAGGILMLNLGTGSVLVRVVTCLLAGAATTVAVHFLCHSETAESHQGLAPLALLSVIAGALVSQIVLQGLGVALWILAAWTIGFALHVWVSQPARELWSVLLAGVLLLQYRFLSLRSDTAGKDVPWEDFYFLFGLATAATTIMWCARAMLNTSNKPGSVIPTIVATLILAALVILFGIKMAPAIFIGALVAAIFETESRTRWVAIYGLISGLFLLQWLESLLIAADLSRANRALLVLGGFGLLAVVWMVQQVWHQAMARKKWPHAPQVRPEVHT